MVFLGDGLHFVASRSTRCSAASGTICTRVFITHNRAEKRDYRLASIRMIH